MMGREALEIERKEVAILRILRDSQEPIGATLIAHRLQECGIYLGERAVRYHLKLMDGRGLTRTAGVKEGRLITPQGVAELECALVGDRVGSALAKIEVLIYRTTLDTEKRAGEVPVNVAILASDAFGQACEIMKTISRTPLPVTGLVAIASAGEKLAGVVIPVGMFGLATISTVVIGGLLLKAGIGVDFRFAGVLQVRNHECLRFVELIEYAGCSLDPAEVFINSRMTSVGKAGKDGDGKILASFCELPALALPRAQLVVRTLETVGVRGMVKIGNIGEAVCETPAGLSKAGMVLTDSLCLMAAIVEAGMEMTIHPMSGMMDFARFRSLRDI